MKFKTNPKFSIIRYTIELEQLLSSYIDLLLDVICLDVKTKEEKFANIFSYKNEYNFDIDSLVACFITTIINDIENKIISQKLIGEILFWDLKNKTILIDKKTKVKNILNNLIKEVGPIEILFSYVLEPYQDFLFKLLPLNPYKYGGCCVNVFNADMDYPIVPITWLPDQGNSFPIDSESIYVSSDFSKLLKTNDKELIVYEWYWDNNDDVQGYVINGILVPLCDITPYITKERLPAFYFKMVESVYSKDSAKYSCKKPDDFIKEAKNNNFVKLLGNLECNFYLKDDNLISNKYSHYFERVISHDSLNYVQNNHIYTNSHVADTNTVLGIYTPEKIGDNFHLLHWISNKENDNKCEHYHGDRPQKYDVKSVYALKPEYSFYFVRKYYEDILDAILFELNCSYILNRSFRSAVDHEVDAIILCDNKIVIIEAKTRLSAKTIEDAIQKIRRLHPVWKETFPDVKVEYITIAQFSDNLDKSIDYFLPEKARKTDFYTKLFRYRFNIKMQQFDGVEIKFISEPSYNKMRNALAKIIQSK